MYKMVFALEKKNHRSFILVLSFIHRVTPSNLFAENHTASEQAIATEERIRVNATELYLRQKWSPVSLILMP